MSKYPFALNLQFFAEEGASETGVESAGEAVLQSSETVQEPEQTGVETGSEAGAKKGDPETAWEKRITSMRQKWEAEAAEKYKDYDTLKEVADYFVEANKERGVSDVLTLKEQIELERLQTRAEKENLPPEVLQRLDSLEARAAKADEYEQQQTESKTAQEFENGLKEFAKDKQIDGKPVDHMELWKYMHENGIAKPEAAFKAMKADVLEKQLETVKQDTIKEYLASKQAPKVEGAGTPGQVQVDTSKLGWGDITKAAAARLQASFTRE